MSNISVNGLPHVEGGYTHGKSMKNLSRINNEQLSFIRQAAEDGDKNAKEILEAYNKKLGREDKAEDIQIEKEAGTGNFTGAITVGQDKLTFGEGKFEHNASILKPDNGNDKDLNVAIASSGFEVDDSNFINMQDGSYKEIVYERESGKPKEIFHKFAKNDKTGEIYHITRQGGFQKNEDGTNKLDENGNPMFHEAHVQRMNINRDIKLHDKTQKTIDKLNQTDNKKYYTDGKLNDTGKSEIVKIYQKYNETSVLPADIQKNLDAITKNLSPQEITELNGQISGNGEDALPVNLIPLNDD